MISSYLRSYPVLHSLRKQTHGTVCQKRALVEHQLQVRSVRRGESLEAVKMSYSRKVNFLKKAEGKDMGREELRAWLYTSDCTCSVGYWLAVLAAKLTRGLCGYQGTAKMR